MYAPRLDETDVAAYKPPQKEEKVHIGVRLPVSVREGVDDVTRLWKLYADARGDNPQGFDLTYVVTRLLEVGIDAAFGEFKMRPRTDAEWKALEKELRAAVSENTPSKSR